MRTPTLHTSASCARLPVWALCLAIATLAVATTSAKQKRGKQAAQPLPAPEIDRNSTRFILPENHADYVNKMLERMSMTKRTSDPFGRAQDPDAAPVVATPDPARQRITSLAQNTPLQQIVSLLKISTIIPNEKRFLVSDRSFQAGDIIPLTYRSKQIKAEVVSVNATQIHFRDSESGETATLDMQLLPPGMQPGTRISEAPGLFRKDKEAPIDLDSP